MLPEKQDSSRLVAADEDASDSRSGCCAGCWVCCDGAFYRKEQMPVQLTFDRLTIDAVSPNSRRIIDGLSGTLGPNEFVAIMGPSGGGKTTLLSALSGRLPLSLQQSGSLLVNQQPLNRESMRGYMKIVPQDDQLFAYLTPLEALRDACSFAGVPSKLVPARVDELLSLFDLQSCHDVSIGQPGGQKGLSGGQKRRLSVALELPGNPSLLLLDEPTSGLDAVSAAALATMLNSLAHDSGTTIITTIHQPSAAIFRCFDRLLLLAKGKGCYLGPVSATQPVGFFREAGFTCPENYNPADFVLEVFSEEPEAATMLVKLGATGALDDVATPVRNDLPALPRPPPSSMRTEMAHLKLLLKRHWILSIREPAVFKARIFSNIFIGLLLGGLFYDLGNDEDGVTQRISLLFFVVSFITVPTIMGTLGLILPELAVVGKEIRNDTYSVGAYYLAKSTVDTPFLFLGPAIFSGIMGPMSGLTCELDRWVMFYAAIVCLALGVHAWAVMLCVLFPDVNSATTIVPITVMPLMLFAGFFKSMEEMSWVFKWLSYADVVAYAWKAECIAIFTDEVYDPATLPSGQPVENPTGEEVLTDRLGLPTRIMDYFIAIIVIVGFIIAFRLLGWLFLYRKFKA